MGRTAVFKGIELVIPDAYSALDVTRLLTPTSGGVGIVALVGESEGGKPGLHIFPGGASPAIVKDELKGGAGAHMSRLALRSGVDGLVQAGASTVLFYKTNNSTQSQLVVGGVREARSVTTVADVAGSLNDTYLDNLQAAPGGTTYYVWFNVNAAGTDPALAGKTGIEVALATGASANDVATAIRAALNAVSGKPFDVAGATNVVLITNKAKGNVTDLVDGAAPTGFTVLTTVQGNFPSAPAAFTIKSKQYGSFTALYTAEIATVGPNKFLTVRDELGVAEVSSAVGAANFMTITRSNAGGATAAQVRLRYVANLLRLQGQHDLGAGLVSAFDLDVTGLTLKQIKTLVEATYAGWTVSIPSVANESFKAVDLDMVEFYQDAFAPAAYGFKASVYELVQWSLTSSQLVEVVRGSENDVDGVPAAMALASLTGGTRGSTSNTDVQNAYNALLDLRVNITVPLFCKDNQDGSTVSIASVNSIVKDHVQSRSAILGRSECQAYVAIQGNKDAFKAESARMGSRYVSVTSQKISDLDIDGNVVTFDEYAFAVVCAQTQAGSPIGTPLTNRLLPVTGLFQDASWKPSVDGAELIKAGCLIAGLDENNQIRVIAGYTSWLGDTNNANIYIETVESLAIFSFNHRQFMKQRFLGVSSFTTQDILDAIKESLEAERDTTRSIKGFDLEQTKLISTTAGRLEYEIAVVPFEGIVFILPTVVAIRETAAA